MFQVPWTHDDVFKLAKLHAPPLSPLFAALDGELEQPVVGEEEGFSTWAARGASGLKFVPVSLKALREVEELSHSLNTPEAPGDRLLIVFDFCPPPGTGPRHSVFECLWALLAQVMVKTRRGWTLDGGSRGLAEHVDSTGKHREWKRTDVFRLFIRSLMDALAFSEERSAILVLANLDDNVDAGGWRIEELRSGIDKAELKFAVVVIGQDAHSLDYLGRSSTNGVGTVSNPTELGVLSSSAAEDSPRVSEGSPESRVRRGSTAVTEAISTADAAIWDLVSVKPPFYDFVYRLRSQLRPLDRWLQRVVCRWQQTSASRPGVDIGEVTESILSESSMSHVLSTIFNSFNSSQKAIAAATVDLLQHGCRTLTVAEKKFLVRAAAFQGDGKPLALEAIESAFCGLVTSHRGKVAYAQPPVAAFLLSHQGQALDIVNSPQSANAILANTCIGFLSSPNNQRFLYLMASQEPGAYPDECSAAVDYAMRYWPEHARRAGREWGPDSAGFRGLLEKGGQMVGAWAMAYTVSVSDGHVGSEESKRDPCVALPILARHDLEGALEQTMKVFRGSDTLSRQQSRAIASAAGGGCLGALRLLTHLARLLPCVEDDAVLAAVECGVDEVLEDVVALLLDREGRRDLDDATVSWLARAASLGNGVAIKTLVQKVFQSSPLIIETMRQRLPSAGSLSGDAAVLDELLRLGIRLSETADQSSRLGMLEPIARYGSLRLVKPFLEGCGEVTAETRILFCQRALATATNYGRLDVGDEILEWASAAGLKVATVQLVRELLQSHSPRCVEMVASRLDRPAELLLTPESPEEFAALVLHMASLESSRHRMSLGVIKQLLGDPLTIGTDAFFRLLSNISAHAEEDSVGAVYDLGIRSGIDPRNHPHMASLVWFWCVFRETMMKASLKRGIIDPGMRHEAEKRTLLGRAAYNWQLGVVAALVEAKADVSDGGDAWTPLHCAYDNEPITKLLVDNGADVNSRDNAGLTALSFSAKWNHD